MPEYPGGNRHSINKFAQGIVDANGNVKIQFLENPGQGFQWQGNLNVINSPSAGIWSLTIGFQQVGNWTGSAPFGPVKMINQDTALITGSGLQPSTTITAQFTGWVDYDDGSVVIPNNVPQTAISVETIVPLLTAIKGTVAAGTATFVFRPPQNTRRITIVLNASNIATAGNIVLIGNQTKATYGGNVTATPWSNSLGIINAGPFFFSIEPTIDSTYTLFVGGANGDTITAWVLASQTNAEVVPIGGATNISGTVNVAPSSQMPTPTIRSVAIVANGTTAIPGTGVTTTTPLYSVMLCIIGAGASAIVENAVGELVMVASGTGTWTISYPWGAQFTTPGAIQVVTAGLAAGNAVYCSVGN